MSGFEVFGDEERKEVNEVLETGVLMCYGFDQARAENWEVFRKKESQRDFSVSNNIMERSLSLLIKQNWSNQKVKTLAQTLKPIAAKSLQNVKIQKHSSSS